MAPDIYNTVAPTRPAQTRSRAVARPPLGKAVAPHATGGGHGVMPRARRPLAVGVLIGAGPHAPLATSRRESLPEACSGAASSPVGLRPRRASRTPQGPGPALRPRRPTPHGDAFGATLEPSVLAAPLEWRRSRARNAPNISREGAIWFQGELVSRSQAYFPRGRYRMCIYRLGNLIAALAVHLLGVARHGRIGPV